ncbi:MAG: MFS transporter [Alphaproteobacteria bacterium]|nr:MFS transporter [Alphaproteobacteria bacterium]
MDSQISLLRTTRFLPLFLVQFFGAFNDNLLKTVLVVLIAYGLWDIGGWDPAVLVAVAAGLFILPFILLCPFAGNLSDKYDKAVMIRWVKRAEIVIALLAVGALYSDNLYYAFFVLLLLGAQSAFFSPCKFAILPQHLKRDELVSGNAWVSSGTYMAILAGTIIGALIAPLEHGKMIASVIIVFIALVGYWAAVYIPKAEPPEPDLHIRYNVLVKIYEVFRHALNQPSGVIVGIVGVSFFYFVAATFHAQFPNFTKQTLGADNIVLTVFMIAFSVGVAVGGLLNHKLLDGKASGVWVPVACVFMGAFGVDIYFAALAYPKPVDGSLHDIVTFVSNFHGVRLLVDTFLQAVACGFFVIPLRAIVQDRSQENVRSRVISSSNMMDAVFILLSSVFSTVVLAMGMTIEELYLSVSVITIFVALALFKIPSLRATKAA